MPYRIKARNKQGNSVTRIDQNPNAQVITDRANAQQIAELFAETRGSGGPWTGYVEYYDETTSIASLKSTSPYDRKNAVVKRRGVPG
jgi:hypothetical protein